LAVTQHHRDDEEKSPRYDILVGAEAVAKNAKKCVHSEKEYKAKTVNDLADPRKAKAYSGSLMRAGRVKAIVEYVFNGSRYKLLVPSENCHIVFALENLRSPQPSAPASVISRGQGKFSWTNSTVTSFKIMVCMAAHAVYFPAHNSETCRTVW
jgi:staphylococcal nuclease domain-containing protein 1